jgi:hypothetical protein
MLQFSFFVNKYYSSDKIKEDGTGAKRSRHGKNPYIILVSKEEIT